MDDLLYQLEEESQRGSDAIELAQSVYEECFEDIDGEFPIEFRIEAKHRPNVANLLYYAFDKAYMNAVEGYGSEDLDFEQILSRLDLNMISAYKKAYAQGLSEAFEFPPFTDLSYEELMNLGKQFFLVYQSVPVIDPRIPTNLQLSLPTPLLSFRVENLRVSREIYDVYIDRLTVALHFISNTAGLDDPYSFLKCMYEINRISRIMTGHSYLELMEAEAILESEARSYQKGDRGQYFNWIRSIKGEIEVDDPKIRRSRKVTQDEAFAALYMGKSV